MCQGGEKMKSGVKVKKVQLTISQKNESALIGIVSTEPDYKLSLSINRKLKLKLKHQPPLTVKDEPGTEHTFSRFTDSSSAHDLAYVLLSNRYGKNYLLKKLKNIDYLLAIQNFEDESSVTKTVSGLKEMDCITAVFLIDASSLKDKNLQYIIQ
jgi:hypothetical protein